MLLSLADAAWRVVLMLALGLSPVAAPLDASPSGSTLVALLRLAVFLVVVGRLAFIVRAAVGRNLVLALAAGATLVASVALSFLLRGYEGPLARGAWIMSPLFWATLAALVATRMNAGARRTLATSALLVAGLVQPILALRRTPLGDHVSLWAQALAEDPGNEHAALVVAARAREAGDDRAAMTTLDRCAAARRGSPRPACRCEEEAAAVALDLGDYGRARGELEGTSACPGTAHRMGLRAEALVVTSRTDKGIQEATVAFQRDPREAHALYALAWGANKKGDLAGALGWARLALANGRGAPARLLLSDVRATLGLERP
jgi:hypothetical protein